MSINEMDYYKCDGPSCKETAEVSHHQIERAINGWLFVAGLRLVTIQEVAMGAYHDKMVIVDNDAKSDESKHFHSFECLSEWLKDGIRNA